MRSSWEWYGVRSVYRATPVGRRLGSDSAYSSDITLVEARVVLIRARSNKEAVKKAAAEAKRYVKECQHRNPYGQRVRLRLLGYLDVYEINDVAKDGTEVYSQTAVVSRQVTDAGVLRQVLGRHESQRVAASRRNVLAIEFAGPAPGVKLTAAELAFVQRYGTLKKRHDA